MNTPTQPQFIQSRDNALVKDLRRLAAGGTGYRRLGRIWVEGEHLGTAALARGWQPALAVFAQSYWPHADPAFVTAAQRVAVLDDALMAQVSSLESPAPMGFVLDLPAAPSLRPDVPTVVLDCLQDAGNVGSILRCASAFGYEQVLAIRGTAGLWSPKVLRAGMGAHFGLQLIESLQVEQVLQLQVPLLVTSSHEGQWLHQADLPWPCAWVLGHEGQGVDAQLMAASQHKLRIAQPGGEESLNVAAAAAICLHASAVAAG